MSANTAFVPQADAPLARPRVRYAAIVFGAIACGIGALGLVMASNPEVRNDVLGWLGTLTPITATLAAFIALGALVLVVAALSLIRAGQRRSAQTERERATAAAAAAAPAAAPAGQASAAAPAHEANTVPFDEVFPWAAAENVAAAANAANATADAASNAGNADDADTVPIADLDAADESGDDTADPSARDGR